MKDSKDLKKEQTKEKKKNIFAIRTIAVLVVLAIFLISTAISLRAQHLHIIYLTRIEIEGTLYLFI